MTTKSIVGRRMIFLVAVAALVCSAAALILVWLRGHVPTAASSTQNDQARAIEVDTPITKEQIARIAVLGPAGPLNALITEMGNRKTLSKVDADFLLKSLRDPASVLSSLPGRRSWTANDHRQLEENWIIVVKRFVLLTVADRLHHAQMDQEVRELLEGAIIESLQDPNWRIRKRALRCVREADIDNLEKVLRAVRPLVQDEVGEIAELAKSIVGSQ